MIRIARTPEPGGLAAVRDDKLTAARMALTLGTKIDFREYDVVKSDLATMQHNKCCYCEKREEQAKYRDVEHFRPKGRYWWLGWTWENLMFACIDCNRDQKRDQFPLGGGGDPLVAEETPPGKERPLVIDPSDPMVDPLDEIRFRPETVLRFPPRSRRKSRVPGMGDGDESAPGTRAAVSGPLSRRPGRVDSLRIASTLPAGIASSPPVT